MGWIGSCGRVVGRIWTNFGPNPTTGHRKTSEKRKYKKLPLLLSGDINRKTAALAKLCEISYNGISLGDHKSNHYLKFIDERIDANIAHKNLKVDLELVHSLKKELEHYKKL